MSQINRSSRGFAIGCALVALLAVGCSKKNGVAFDPDAGHPDDFFPTHSAAYRAALEDCDACHGTDLLGGISAVSCYSTSRDGQSCHPGGPGGHPAGWRALHSADQSKAATCAPCHDNKSNDLPPNCFDNSLCHGPKSGHPAGWRNEHSGIDPAQASICAECHDNGSNSLPPNCFDNSLCHGAKSSHPAGWLRTHTGTSTTQAAVCADCHQSSPGPPGCFNNTLCHGTKGGQHPAGWRTDHQSTSQSAATGCAGCHPDIGTPNCFTNTSCHGAGGGHPPGWSAGSQHGAAAKSAPGGSTGFAYCEGCHGSGLGGGSAPSCVNASCHGWGAPHARSGWDGGGSSHRSTNVGNVTVCAQCHPVAPPPSGTTCTHNGDCH